MSKECLRSWYLAVRDIRTPSTTIARVELSLNSVPSCSS